MENNWEWAVIYEDDSEHFESDLGGFEKVEQDRVKALIVFDEGTGQQYVTYIHGDQRPIFFRRSRRTVNPNTEEEVVSPWLFATVFGWQKTVNGANVKSLTWLLFDGSVVLSDCDIDEF